MGEARVERKRPRDITQGEAGLGDWSHADIVYFLETGSTPDFDVVGEAMVPVQENMAQLPAHDRDAIAAYLKTLRPRLEAVKTP